MKRKGLPENFLNISITVGIAALLMEILVLTKHDYFYQQEARLQDWLMTRLVRPELPQNYILLAIDEATIKLDNVEPDEIANSRALQEMKKGYPFSRAVYGELIDRLVGAGAKLVIFDLVLRGSKPGDEVLIGAVKRHPGKVLFGSNFDVDDESNSFTYTEPPAEIVEGAAVGLVNFPITLDGVARSMFFKGTPQSIQLEESHKDALTVPSLAGAANRLLGGDTPDTLKPFRFLFSQRLPKKRNVPLYEVFVPALWKANLKDGAVFKDSVVLLGATEAVFQDYHQTPLGRMPGPELQLHQLAALQGHWWLSDFGKPMMFASVILAAMLAYLVVFLRRSMVVFTIIILGGAAFWVLVAMAYLHWQHAFIPVIAPLSTWAVCGFVGIVTQISHERRERKRRSQHARALRVEGCCEGNRGQSRLLSAHAGGSAEGDYRPVLRPEGFHRLGGGLRSFGTGCHAQRLFWRNGLRRFFEPRDDRQVHGRCAHGRVGVH